MRLAAVLARLDAYEKLVRLDKPVGILLLLWPTLWGLWLAARAVPDWRMLWIFALGTVLMRSAGCAINDWADRSFDPQVERTRERPLAAGTIHPEEAVLVAASLAFFAFMMVVWMLNLLTVGLAVVAGGLAGLHEMRAPMPPFHGTDAERESLAKWLWERADRTTLAERARRTGEDLGRLVYRVRCGTCHVEGGFNDKRPKVLDFTEADLRDLLATDLAKEMPVFSGDDAEREALIRHLLAWKEGAAK